MARLNQRRESRLRRQHRQGKEIELASIRRAIEYHDGTQSEIDDDGFVLRQLLSPGQLAGLLLPLPGDTLDLNHTEFRAPTQPFIVPSTPPKNTDWRIRNESNE
jgi:hypothetical protein